MLDIAGLTYRIAGRTLFDDASAFIAEGWKVGVVGRNGTGKSTLLRLIREEAGAAGSAIRLNAHATLGFVAQEAPQTDTPLIDEVLAMDRERAALLAEAETASDPHRIAEIQLRLVDIDAYSAEGRASAILKGLGFSEEDLQRPCRAFSGGWRMRAALAGVLAANPDLLLLDEPTNYLDLEGAAWLETYLKRCRSTVLLVSHDREMLNRAVTHILALDAGKLEVFTGGYDAYQARRAMRLAGLSSQKEKQDADRARLQAFIDRFRAKASKARQAQSRVKALERMQEIVVPLEARARAFDFPEPEQLASPLVVLEGADLGYAPGRPVLREVSFRLDHDDRIVIIGPNGQGKTTLVKSIAARIALLKGGRVAARTLRIGYFSQDQLDELEAKHSPLDHARKAAPGASDSQVRGIAAAWGFGHEKIATPAEKLSGGEKVRLLMGMMAHARPHVLILDEPTSHLDIDSREALIHAINGFSGAVLLITHDVYLAEACADRLWLVHGGRARPYEGDLSDYRALVLAADRPSEARATSPSTAPPANARKPSASTLKRALAKAEADLEAATQALAAIDARLAGGQAATARLAAERAAAESAVQSAEAAWLAAGEALEALS